MRSALVSRMPSMIEAWLSLSLTTTSASPSMAPITPMLTV
jgi:hypothetical protein